MSAPAYLDFLNRFGWPIVSALPEAMPHIELGISDITNGVSELQIAGTILAGKSQHPVLGAASFSPTAAEIELENGLILKRGEMLKSAPKGAAHEAIGDGRFIALLRNIYALIQANPALVSFIETLLQTWIKVPVA